MRASSPNIRPEKTLRDTSSPTLDESLFEAAFENAPQAMAVLSTGGNVLRANRSLCQLLGFARAELQALSCVHLVHPEDFATESQQRRRLAAADIGRYELVLRHVRKDGQPVWIRLAVAATRHAPAGDTNLIAVMEPVASRAAPPGAKGEAWLRQFSDAALSAAHEIGNSLTPLMLNTEMILEHAKKRELRDSAHQIFMAARRIAFALRRLRGIEDGPAVAYVGQNRMLDLRLIAPPCSALKEDTGNAPA
jgi:PAS domain S-box-containing protein